MSGDPLNVPGATPLPVEDWQELLRDAADQLDEHFGCAPGEYMASSKDIRALAAYLPTLAAALHTGDA